MTPEPDPDVTALIELEAQLEALEDELTRLEEDNDQPLPNLP